MAKTDSGRTERLSGEEVINSLFEKIKEKFQGKEIRITTRMFYMQIGSYRFSEMQTQKIAIVIEYADKKWALVRGQDSVSRSIALSLLPIESNKESHLEIDRQIWDKSNHNDFFYYSLINSDPAGRLYAMDNIYSNEISEIITTLVPEKFIASKPEIERGWLPPFKNVIKKTMLYKPGITEALLNALDTMIEKMNEKI